MSTDVQEPEPLPGATQDELIAAGAAAGTPPEVIADSLGEYVKIWISRVRNGESGALPVILGLVAIVIYFQARSSLFLSAGNLVNLTTQAAFIIMLGMAEVFVLLLGEIDLSIGYTSALGATFTCWLLLPPNPAPWPLAVLVGLAVPAIFSGLEGVMVTRLRLPSFVVTLAGQLLAFGLLLEVMNSAAPSGGGSIRLFNNVLSNIEGGALSPLASWIVMIVAVALAAVTFLVRDTRRRASNLTAPPLSVTAAEDRRDGGRGRARGARREQGPRRRPHRGARRALGGAAGPGGGRSPGASCWAAPGSAGTSTPSAATPRRLGGPESTSAGSGSSLSRCAG